MAWSSGLLDMIADARLISDGGRGGTETGLVIDASGGDARYGLSASPMPGLTRLISADCLGLGCATSGFAWLRANASSWLKSLFSDGDAELSKLKFAPCSCNNENWSKVGNRDDSSSAVPDLLGLASRAAKGSPFVTRIGEGLGFVGTWAGEPWLVVGGLPRLIGTISGRACVCCTGGGENTAPIPGVPWPFWLACFPSPAAGSAWARPE